MKIICVGRNYVDHIKELSNEKPKDPVIFLKPDTALLDQNSDFYYPSFSQDVHHEIELVFRISKVGKNIESKFAHKYIDGIGLGIDFTARDLQAKLKEKGLPWEKSKAFNGSAFVSQIRPLKEGELEQSIPFRLDINGTTVQAGESNLMIWNISELIADISQYFTLKTGDYIFTGTPAGVGPVKIGDQLNGFLYDEKLFDLNIS
ncbi:fumarylacetoacetate hydrolase family protein [Aquirufa ecclesiirivi]|uniref:Fumarylacetoacetate hydrolase family protein n=1 Tax=Aquirufa ecclesiirivi TaxID=2715124 RepID=A0ABT4JD16_9BACT|nr:fumarylacetoacetate hydrolase family protein [Aquirufa ecclesiirivi]MCZ2474182.1 fumarylacetoacetate hydrolase family protein [Aquirufa ecclesiirivi]MDF0693848.1 fumarylacetoacetate hydrolase family protein [Aquirufa ecclesiirivi]NHC48526.1 fumarylacetoacetate hydrolase family protein [Aquirufa ecclesiirivi]